MSTVRMVAFATLCNILFEQPGTFPVTLIQAGPQAQHMSQDRRAAGIRGLWRE